MSIQVVNISKQYKKVHALKNISFQVNKGEIFGLIGPDGAGKTTLFRILTTLLLADSGSAIVMGKDVIEDYKSIRKEIGYMPGKFSLYQDLTVAENLTFFAALFGVHIRDNYNLIAPIYKQLEPFKNRRAGQLSGGMKQKLALCCALIHKPSVLFLDEPTTGVDPVSRKEFWEMLQQLQKQGITILVSTPYMDEAALCNRIALLQNGTMLAIETPQAITQKYVKHIYKIQASTNIMYNIILALKKYNFQQSVYLFGDTVHYTDVRGTFNTDELKKYLNELDIANVKITATEASIEDVFIDLLAKENNE